MSAASMDVGQIVLTYGIDEDGDETYGVQQTEGLSTLIALGLLEYAKLAITGNLDHAEYQDDQDEDQEDT